VLLKSTLWPVSRACCATADLSGCPSLRCRMCSCLLISVVLFVCPVYVLSHSHGMQHTLGTFSPGLSFTDLSKWLVFLAGTFMVLMCLVRSLLILWEVECWYGRSAAQLVFLCSSFVLFLFLGRDWSPFCCNHFSWKFFF
jgi:hypothetical protein